MRPQLPPVFTIGHSTRTVEEFVGLLRVGAVNLVVDVRRSPQSRTNPQFDLEVLPLALATRQTGYVRIEELGGRRPRSPTVPPDVNGYWTNRSFHNYADYAMSEQFRVGLSKLAELSHQSRVAIMCSEAVWWRCHRRFVADYLLHQGRDVFHLMDLGHAVPASMTPAAVERGFSLAYPADPSSER